MVKNCNIWEDFDTWMWILKQEDHGGKGEAQDGRRSKGLDAWGSLQKVMCLLMQKWLCLTELLYQLFCMSE